MTATFVLQRYKDISGVSGLGPVAFGAEFDDGSVALHWPGEHPSTAVWPDIRDVEAVHGHEGTTVVVYQDPTRLLGAYQRVIPWLITPGGGRPLTCAPHPDHPDRLRLTFHSEELWAFWVALLDGSTHAATHEEVNGEIATTWISPDGNLWLQYFTPGTFTDLLEGERYSPTTQTPGPSWESHDDPEVTQ